MKLNDLSIVIPVWNEEENVRELVKTIHSSRRSEQIVYELIFVDDYSTDNTVKTLEELSADYPIRIYYKVGQRGKAQSLIQGFSYCRYPVVAMIDADLQYSPQYIPLMLEKIEEEQLDIVIADRVDHESGFVRKFISKVFTTFFVRLLHGFKVDCQSGLKLFRKKILDHISLNSVGWAFDLDFLVQARAAGFKIGSVPIVFLERFGGKSKVNIIHASWQIGMDALRLKLQSSPVLMLKTNRDDGQGFSYKGATFIHHSDLHHEETALRRFSNPQILFLFSWMGIYAMLLFLNWHMTLLITLATLTLLYFADLIFNLFLIYRSFKTNPTVKVSDRMVDKISDDKWPRYTVFCPLYKEWQVIPQFVTAMSKLDYPKDKLQVMLLLEENDAETIAKTAQYDLPEYFSVVIVPHSMPKTKPKALNYGLVRATGDYVVIYDAEDVPDPRQLKKAVLAFNQLDEKTICVQAKLNFYNPHQNILTRVFTAEYSLWFDLTLPGMQSISGPIPLGGTSNHFRKKDVVRLKGWDAFNVTEDCDLGIRLAKNGFRTAMIESTTLEEANSHLWNWFSQRSRWIKGYIQTYLVHMRDPGQFIKNAQHYHLLAFQFIVGGKILSMFINPVMWCITVTYFALRPIVGEFIESFFPAPILYIGVVSFVVGNFLYLYYYMIAVAKRGQFELVKYVFFVPFYWLMMSFASWRALYEIIFKPHYWAKTLHGLHLASNKGLTQSRAYVGREVIDAGL